MSYCKICAGTGRCINCDGTGYPQLSHGDPCAECEGLGNCIECQGTGDDGLPKLSTQEQVAENTRKRGYREGWTSEQFAARQVCKLVEELNELDDCFRWFSDRDGWRIKLNIAAQLAKERFDSSDGWDNRWITDEEAKIAQKELADIQVVVFNLAQALAEITNEPFDVVQAAVAKSESDIERGKR